jgi:hypothetical protein
MKTIVVSRWQPVKKLCLLIAGFGWFTASPALWAADAVTKFLSGHVADAAAHLSAKGNYATTNRLNLAIGLALRDAPGLDDFLAQVSDPASPDYRHYLTPEEFTERFGPTEQDYQAVIDFAKHSGFTITATNATGFCST